MTDGPKRPTGQDELPGLVVEPVRKRTELAVERACRLAHEQGHLLELDAAAATLAVELGRSVDVAQARRDPYAVAAVARELRELLIRLRLDPTARGGDTSDPIEQLLAEFGKPSTGTAEVRDPAQP